MADTILITGISGFVGFYCALEALRQGFDVRGTLRADKPKLRELLSRELGEDPGARLSFVRTNLLEDAGWDAAVDGCRYALHVASPVSSSPVEDLDAYVPEARGGALRLLRAAAASEQTERVVMTSSSSAVMHGLARDADTIHDESSWTDPDRCGPYPRSKTLAERAAWSFVEALPPGTLELVTLCPGMIYGPVPDPSIYSPSGEPVRKLLTREIPACPDFGWAAIDVRDVALLHLRGLTVAAAGGQRFCAGLDHLGLLEISKILAPRYRPRGYRVPTRRMPSVLVKFASRFDAQVRYALSDLGLYERMNIDRARKVLGWEPRPVEQAIVDMADSMIALGMV